MDKEEIKKEKIYLSNVKKILNHLITDLSKSIDRTKNEVDSLKKFMWDNLSDYTDEERAISMYEVDTTVDITNMSVDTLNKYEKALNAPYFAKVSFKDDEYNEDINVYIGICSVKDKHEFYVFDWRSPIASLFYNYEVGKAKYDCPNGEISGEITEKMQFKIVEGDLIRCFKSNINIDDEYLQEILVSSSSDKMKNIVTTIQREQNLIIRNERDKYLIVQGSAGSGKTSVALHRIAYLLYKDINLDYNNVLILSPNDVFSDYISDVLPELGEKNVLKTTFSDFAQNFLKPYKNIENYSDFLDRVYTNKKIDNEEIKYKLSNECKNDIDSFFEDYESNVRFNENISKYNMKVSSTEIQDMFLNRFKKLPLNERIDMIIEDICLRLNTSYKKNYNNIKKFLFNSSNLNVNLFDLYSEFCKKMHVSGISNNKKILYEDITPLIYINFKLNGIPVYNNIKQVVIDEVQDYTLFQMNMISKLFKNSSFTLLGDVNQTINPFYSYDILRDLDQIFDHANYLELTKTYRSSEEIVDYSNKILNLNNTCAVRKSNNIPVKIETVDTKDLVEYICCDLKNMKLNGCNHIAIITKTAELAKKINKILNDDNIQLLISSNDVRQKNIVIIPSYLAKGLEFDGVVVCNESDNDYDLKDKKLYYVVCTRAQHQLSIYNEPKKILKKESFK